MATFNSLPIELLIMIATNLGLDLDYNRKKRRRALCSMAKVGRSCGAAAQEVLHQSVAIFLPDPPERGSRVLSPIAQLARTLLKRPDLAKKVLCLYIEFLQYHRVDHTTACSLELSRFAGQWSPCDCGWSKIADLCGRCIQSHCPDAKQGQEWSRSTSKGNPNSLIGVILACVTGVETITLIPMERNYQFSRPVESLVDIQQMTGGYSNRDLGSFVRLIPGLKNAKNLHVEGSVTWPLFALPNIQYLRIGMRSEMFWEMVPPSILIPPAEGLTAATWTLSNLTVDMNIDILDNPSEYPSDFHDLFGELMERLNNLICLHVYLSSPHSGRTYSTWPTTGFQHLVDKIKSESLSILIIDEFDLDEGKLETMWGEGFCRTVDSIRTLEDLPSLKRLVAPQEAFMCVEPTWTVCPLPNSLEEIGVLDSTDALNRWAQSLVTDKSRALLTDLKKVTLWPVKEEKNLVPDYRLEDSPDYDFSETSSLAPTWHDDETESVSWKTDWMVHGHIWSLVGHVGIDVSLEEPSNRGWCRE
ncbi:hypothetical protein K504DRAFT_498119 [Pleomassaria siparia CBS 279.74]|uniref:F-box domain-containing protein n=1 Tax=Pleomassaria siparia CBS 279.74 TaxID=1314801 RepID=A0A6G1KLE5_9PLEO|nr:hypothetical protein K504DRAFT_498119 [Pleomassaria siparia CBS 279.74]